MPRMRPLACLLAAFLSATWVKSQETPNGNASLNASDKCTLEGIVLRKDTGEPIQFARVTLQKSDGDETPNAEKKRLVAVTGADGKFSIGNIPPGEYTMVVIRNGYVPEFYGARRVADRGIPLTLAAGKKVDDLLFRLTPNGVITGRVRDENGQPLPGARISAQLSSFSGRAGRRGLEFMTAAQTNDLGEYRLYNLPPGKYILSAQYSPPPTVGLDLEDIGFVALQEERDGFVTTYYPGTTDPDQVSPIEIAPGAQLQSVDFFLRPSGTFHVRGHLVGIESKARGDHVFVMLRSSTNAKFATLRPQQRSSVNLEDGSFDIDQVASGSYELVAIEMSAIAVSQNSLRTVRRPVEVHAADVDGLELAFEPAATIIGHLRWDNSPPAANIPLHVTLEADDSFFRESSSAMVQPDGSFELNNVSSGSYSVSIMGPAPDGYLKSAQYGSTDALGTFRTISGSGPTLEITLSTRGARIQGRVMNSDPLPVPGAWVTLIPTAEADRKLSRLYKSAQTDRTGKYELRGIAPGNYELFSWDSIDDRQWEDPEFLKPYLGKGASITVGEGDNKSVDLATLRANSDASAQP